MSTENEGNEVPPAPSEPPAAPPAAPDTPAAHAADGAAPSAPADRTGESATTPPAEGATTQLPPVPPAPEDHAAHGHPAPGPAPQGWAAPPPAVPAYAGAGGGGHEWGAAYQPPPHASGRGKGGLVAGVLAAALVAGGLGGGIGYWAAERNDNSADSTTVSASETPADLKREPGTVSAIAQKALPSVVTIDAQSGGGEGGTGTGFVYDREGHILTNNHVVASAAEGGQVSATFSNGKKYDAEVIGRAQGYDVAVLKLKKADGLKPLSLGNSEKVAVGDSTIAIGAPFGLSNTVTTGIISAKNRPVTSSDGASNKSSYMSALQTDASINPGNSGGPLLDARGAVIGINSAIKPAESGSGLGGGQGGSIGLGFAIPINQVKNVAEQLIKSGKAVYPMIGASVSIEERSDGGAQVSSKGAGGGAEPVTPGGPADKAGIEPGDVITKLNDRIIDSGPTLISEIWTHKPGEKVKLTYKRDGKERTVDVELGSKGED
ncbi:Periplasmic pH-dependent serine endoprotease DegQ precursor [Streptomyces sp. YIM 130001]|uniref:S1C family serine protease n=1 Tax=Streptomyces sp. YIM 130001 TaxID=2259644 RepID=UPI000E65C174|nr:trypsin-like peptidase domain-containing protein [Streptomyces sp. YIM 130001]RII11927.1 Periplasmic pH-dependent serine endoprotease DegQ precursor [Streptomyces sp. YIM 130001]